MKSVVGEFLWRPLLGQISGGEEAPSQLDAAFAWHTLSCLLGVCQLCSAGLLSHAEREWLAKMKRCAMVVQPNTTVQHRLLIFLPFIFINGHASIVCNKGCWSLIKKMIEDKGV